MECSGSIDDDMVILARSNGDSTGINGSMDEDGDSNLETRCPWALGPLENNDSLWQSMGAAYLVQSSATAPVLFFYNSDDQPYYHDQATQLKAKLDRLGVPNSILLNYGSGHSVPQTAASLNFLYRFFQQYLAPPAVEKG